MHTLCLKKKVILTFVLRTNLLRIIQSPSIYVTEWRQSIILCNLSSHRSYLFLQSYPLFMCHQSSLPVICNSLYFTLFHTHNQSCQKTFPRVSGTASFPQKWDQKTHMDAAQSSNCFFLLPVWHRVEQMSPEDRHTSPWAPACFTHTLLYPACVPVAVVTRGVSKLQFPSVADEHILFHLHKHRHIFLI